MYLVNHIQLQQDFQPCHALIINTDIDLGT